MSDTKQSCCSTDEVGCVDPDQCRMVCENPAGCTNIAYPKLVIELMPTGLKGVMLAAMMAALMSSLTSVFNSSATIFTIDIWKRFRIAATETEMLVVGRVFVLILIGLSIVWVPVLQASQGGQLFNYIQAVTGYFAPPILALFLLAILWERTNEQGAFWGLMVGLVIGIVRMALDFGYGSPDCGEEDTRPVIIRRLHFLHFTILLFVVSFVATVVITVLTPPIKKSHLIRLTWWTRHSEEEREEFPEEKARHEKVKAKIAAKVDEEEFKVSDTRTLPAWRRFLYAFCGYEQPKDVDMSQEEESAHKKLLTEQRLDFYFCRRHSSGSNLIQCDNRDSLRNRDEASSAKLEKDRTETFVNQKRCYSNKMASSSVGFGSDKRQCLDADILLDSCSRLRLAMTECCSTRPSLPAGEKPSSFPLRKTNITCAVSGIDLFTIAQLYLLSNELSLKVTGWF
ncbi:hypothetical protein C0Q70_19948 [Pomacea canaliculata]|uniref:Sodium/glucose cotransporter 4 n=1 Tax=Pomacea canaliculata TaxID=400727 RepID=A0A2T7NE63_POMCA|nr:hypothetical protein C0Q70_19948 [Pomacea canaliculata]